MKLIKFLNYPYPFYENTWQSFKMCLSIGLFITAFCYFFKPFGLVTLPVNALLGYGLVSFIVCSLYMVILPLFFNSLLHNKNWKIYKEIIWILIINISLAVANYFYSGFVFNLGYKFNFKIFLIVLLYTVIIAVIPAITIILYKQLFVYKKIIRDTQNIQSKIGLRNLVHTKLNKNDDTFAITSENNSDNLHLRANDFYFISSAGNYVEVFHLVEDSLQKKLIRNNISKVELQLGKFDNIMRCHRSHIINLDNIKRVTGNLQGYQLHFDQIEESIPVSRSFSKKIKRRILNN